MYRDRWATLHAVFAICTSSWWDVPISFRMLSEQISSTGTGCEGVPGVMTSRPDACILFWVEKFSWVSTSFKAAQLTLKLEASRVRCWARDSWPIRSGARTGLFSAGDAASLGPLLAVASSVLASRCLSDSSFLSLSLFFFVLPPQAVSQPHSAAFAWQHCPSSLSSLHPQALEHAPCPCGSHSRGLTFWSPVRSLSQYHQSVKRSREALRWVNDRGHQGYQEIGIAGEKWDTKNRKFFDAGKHIVNELLYRIFQFLKALSGEVLI